MVRALSAVVAAGLLATFATGCAVTADDGESTSEDVTAGGLAPANWNVDADPASPSPGSEPINVILSLENGANLDAIMEDLEKVDGSLSPLRHWKPVDVGAGFAYVEGLAKGEHRCISAEKGTIDGKPNSSHVGTLVQEKSYRLGGCLGVPFDGESHARVWSSKLHPGTLYLALSQEHVCKANVGGQDKAWHCILPRGFRGGRAGITGSTHDLLKGGAINIQGTWKPYESARGGYDQGRDDFVAQLERLPEVAGYAVKCESVKRPSGLGLKVPVSAQDKDDPEVATEYDTKFGRILKRVPWDNVAAHCTITAR